MSVKKSLFAAVLSPTGLHVLEYKRRRRQLEIVRYRSEAANHTDIEVASEALANLLEAEGARGGELALAVAGFGSCHQLLTLPPAAPDLLEPIVNREMRRFFPDLFQSGAEAPFVAYVPTDPEGAGLGSPMRDLLAAAVPRVLVEQVRAATAARGIRVDHITVVPVAITRLFESFVGSRETAALAVVTPDYASVGFFHDGALRLFTEPPAYGREGGASTEQVVADQVERGSLYLRQQFRGARLSAVHVGADREDQVLIRSALDEKGEAEIRELVAGESPGALLALGAALDRQAEYCLNLLPLEYRPPSAAERWVRGLGVAAAAILLLGAGFWTLMGVRAEAEAAELVRTYEESLVPRLASYARIEPVVRERQAHAARAELLRKIVADRERLPELLWPLNNASGSIDIAGFALNRTAEGWSGQLTGTSRSYSSAAAAAAAQGLFDEFSRELPEGTVTLNGLNTVYAAGEEVEEAFAPVSVSFSISFAVSLDQWELE